MRVVHACSACVQCMGAVHACSACVQCMRAVHACSACAQCMRAVHTRSACAQCMRAGHARSACVQCMRAVHARSACVHCVRAVRACSACVQCMRAVHARPGRKEGLQGVALGGRRGSRGCQGRTRLRKWLPFYVLSLPRGHWRPSPGRWCFATFRPQPLQNLRKSKVFSYPPSGSAPALSVTHARARSNVYQHISQGMPRGLTRRGGLRSQRGGLKFRRFM